VAPRPDTTGTGPAGGTDPAGGTALAGAVPEPAAVDVRRDRRSAARRLALAAVASGLVHLALYGGLSATHIGLFDGRPRDATAPRPALRPKIAADYPLTVPRSPAPAPAHERPLDLAAPPAAAPERPRPAPEAVVDRARAPEQPTEPAVAKPDLSRIEPSRDEAAKQAEALERRMAAAAAEPAATADRLPVAAARESAPAAPRPAATRRRPATAAAAVTSRDDGPPEAPATAAGPARVSVPRDGTMTPAPVAIDRPMARRAPAVTAAPIDVPVAAVDMSAAGAPAAATVSPPVARPSRDPARLATRPGAPRAAIRSPSPAGDGGGTEAADGAAARIAIPSIRPLSPPGAATGRQGTGPQPAGEEPGGGSAAAPAPLTRAAPASTTAATPSDATASGVADPPAWTAATPPARPTGGGPAPAATAGSRLAVRSSGRGGATPSDSRAGTRPATAASGRTAAPAIAGPSAAAGTDAEESLSVGGAGDGRARIAAPRRDAAGRVAGRVADDGGGGGGRDMAPGPAGAAAGGADIAGDPTAPLVARPLGRSSVFALPAEGREREVAVPFARRSRAARDAANRDAGSDIAVREKARIAADGMVDRGLDFLARAQRPDGRWRLESYPGSDADAPRLASDTAATGLAILSFLGAGHDHFGGRHRDTVRRGLEFLLSVQKPDGDLYVPADELSDSCAWLYSHGIASMALCEAVGMTGDPLVKPAAARACGFIAASQHPSRGGWRYTPRSDADLSVSGWMLVALRSGRLAGVDVDPRALAGVKTLLEQSAVAGEPARYLYNPRNAQQRPSRLSSACMTAVGTLGRLHTGWSPADPRVRRAADTLLAMRPAYGTPTQRTRDCYLWYYASQVLVHTGGSPWADWYDGLADTLERTQERSGPTAGSWDPLGDVPDRWGAYGGRLYVTTLHLLTLEVPDRRLPTYGSPDDVREPPPTRGSKP